MKRFVIAVHERRYLQCITAGSTYLDLLWSGACVFTVEATLTTEGDTYCGKFVAAVACDDALMGTRCPSYGREETF